MTINKDRSTQENVEFWNKVEATAQNVEQWPAWKKQYVIAADQDDDRDDFDTSDYSVSLI